MAQPRTSSFLNSRPDVQIKCDIDVTRVKLLSQATGTHHLVTDPGWENSIVDTYISMCVDKCDEYITSKLVCKARKIQ